MLTATVSTDAPERRPFIVVTWEEGPEPRRVLHEVQAESHEDAVAEVAATQALTDAGVLFEVWPESDPASVLKVTLKPRRPRPPFPV